MAITQADIRKYIEKTTGEKQYAPSKSTVVSKPQNTVTLPTYAQNAAVKAKINQTKSPYSSVVTNRAASVAAAGKKVQEAKKNMKQVEIPAVTKIAAQHYGSNPMIRNLLQKDPSAMSVWIGQNMQTYKQLPKPVQEYMDYAIVQSQSKQAREVPGAAQVMAGGSGFTSGLTLGMNSGIDQSAASKELEQALNKAHPVANFVGKGLGYTANSAVPDELLLAALAAKKVGQGAFKQAVRTGAALGTSNMAQGLVEDTVTGKTAKEKAANAALNFGFGGVLGGMGGAVAAQKGVMLPTGKEIAEKRAKTVTSMAKTEGSSRVETDAFNGGTVGKDMPTIIKEYKDSTDKSLVDFANAVFDTTKVDKNASNRMNYTIGPVNSKTAGDIKEITGLDIGDYEHSLPGISVIHINKRHGTKGIQDQSMADLNDLARIKYVLDNYDKVRVDGTKSAGFSNKDGKAASKVVYEKRINGNFYVIEAVPDTKAKKMYVVSAYKSAANKKTGQQPPDVQAPGSTSEIGSARPVLNSNIPQEYSGVNNSIRNIGGNNAGLAGKSLNLGDEVIAYKAQAEQNVLQKINEAFGLSDEALLPDIRIAMDELLANGKIGESTVHNLLQKSFSANGGAAINDGVFTDAIMELTEESKLIRHYSATTAEPEPVKGITAEAIKAIEMASQNQKKIMEQARKRNLLTNEDKKFLTKLHNGTASLDDIPDDLNKKGIADVYRAEKAYWDKRTEVFEHKKAVKQGNVKYETTTVTDDVTKEATEVPILRARQKVAEMATEIQRGGFGVHRIGLSVDLDRILENAAGKSKELYEGLRNAISRPLYAAKAKYTEAVKKGTDGLYNDVVQKLGIRKGSKESAAVQWIGEGQRQVKGEIVAYDLADLKRDFPQSWQKIIEAEQWFRKQYDDYVGKINRTLEEIYPDPFDDVGELIVGRRLIARKDYFHHFLEEANNPKLRDILNNATMDIDPRLVGVSEFTKPKSKFWGALQQRGQGAYTEDAVGGFLNYLPAAEYKINIEPVLPQFRAVKRDIQEATKNTKNANQFISWLDEYTNSLAGKSNPIDRGFVLKPFGESGRKVLTVVDRVSGRMRSNAVMANVSSMLSQVYNLPNVLAYVKDPRYIAQGYAEAVLGRLGKGNSQELLVQSPFLNERYLDRSFRRFDEGIVKNGNRLFARCLEIGDEAVAKGGWLAAYRKSVAEGLSHTEAIEQADLLIRKSIAGRGIGEIPLAQKAKVTKAFAPFQVEVNNTYNMLKELVGKKDALAITEYMIGIWLLNEGRSRIDGNQIGFDPIGTVQESWDSEKSFADNVAASIMPLAGDFLGNVPLGQYIAQFTDSTLGTDGFGQSVFGDKDPSRFGTGNIAINTLFTPVGQAIKGQNIDLLKPAASLVLPYAGKQVERSIKGLQDLAILPKVDIQKKKDEPLSVNAGRQLFPASYSNKNDLRFTIDRNDPVNATKNVLFGPFSTKEGKAYLENGSQPYTKEQTKRIEEGYKKGIAPNAYIDVLEKMKAVQGGDGKAERERAVIMKSNLTPQQKSLISVQNGKDKENRIDYTDKHTFKLTTEYSDKVQGYAKRAKTMGIDTERFLNIYDAVNGIGSTNGIKLSASRNKKALIDRAVYTKAQRELFYELFVVSKQIW